MVVYPDRGPIIGQEDEVAGASGHTKRTGSAITKIELMGPIARLLIRNEC